MGKVQVEIEVINLLNREKKVKRVAIVDTGVTMLCLPRAMIEELELEFLRFVEVRTTNGKTQRRIYGGARLFIKDRSATVDVVELDDNLPPLVGVVPLEVMDFVVYPDKLDVFANPEHNGEYMIDLL
ncbi:MAG: aspartyl protease family protein [Campylobacterales bacterium]|nr:aspartyl protease family protein [Campylobacterales bacterium]